VVGRRAQRMAAVVLFVWVSVVVSRITHEQQPVSSSSITQCSQRENHQRPNEPVITPHHSGRDIPSTINSPDSPAGTRSVNRTPGPVPRSAHLPVAWRESAEWPTH
jgi:hypothetical protein